MDVVALSKLISEWHQYLLLHRCCFCVAAIGSLTSKHRQLISVYKYSAIERWPRMTLNGVMALIFRYLTEFGSFRSTLHKGVHVRCLVKKVHVHYLISWWVSCYKKPRKGYSTFDRDFIPHWRCCWIEISSAHNCGQVNILWMKGTGRSVRS